MQFQPKQVSYYDSRHTDMLGAWLVGCPSIQVATLPHPSLVGETPRKRVQILILAITNFGIMILFIIHNIFL